MQQIGFLASIILHTLILVGIIFWPESEPKKINSERYLVSMVIGEMGGENLPSPVAGVRPPNDKKPNIAPEPVKKFEENTQSQAVNTPSKETVKDMPDATPIPKKPEQKPKPDKEAVPSEKPKPVSKPNKPNKPKKPQKNNAVQNALKDANQKTSSSALDALAEFQEMQEAGGGGGTGTGNGGGGIYDVYAAQVILAVQPNWKMPTYSRQNLVVQVRIKLDIAGNVMNASIEESSGRADFDASAVNAVLRTKTLPKPPTKEQQDLIISFNSLELAGN